MKQIEKKTDSPRFQLADRRSGDALRAPRFDDQPACRFCGEDCGGFH